MGEVSWTDAAWVSTVGIAFIITAVGITFFSIMILATMSLARLRIVRRLVVNFGVGFAFSFLNLFLLFGAVFAFPAVVINTILTTCIYAWDMRTAPPARLGWGGIFQRYVLNLAVAAVSTVLGACLIKYTPGVLHKRGEVPPIEWERDFQTWEGLGGWLFVNLAFGSLSLIFGCVAETWLYTQDVRERAKSKAD
mmetsp:Transcript_17968/g.45310  ORF Transcript_17968/g.45310 Transcript_17968/m.45310 type:complete len:194 (-) Transcript_17968:88-669(-)|eukprot:CAMPEP_0174926320 /NCGR_PEP_ID=MMETSP1355-20121228/11187_1 /TAXON_ID=464990 /ORGANISM="Hemiselmis tepida, Strain CCMP443" /LENGTH=193 /DNA_ID=CAMNT_0016172347 /DNA_START=24 /DNA_END=605 /DNA_ORIENTATION=+